MPKLDTSQFHKFFIVEELVSLPLCTWTYYIVWQIYVSSYATDSADSWAGVCLTQIFIHRSKLSLNGTLTNVLYVDEILLSAVPVRQQHIGKTID